MEIWKIVEEYPRLEVSNLGSIRHTKTKEKKYTKVNKQGYKDVQIKENGKRYTLKLHRLIATTFLPPPSEQLQEICRREHHGVVLVNHKDGDKLNNTPNNLEWCRASQNNKHASANNLIPVLRGQQQGKSTLTDAKVHEICQAFENGMMPKEATRVFEISHSQATKMRAGHAWKHISEQYQILVNKRS